MRQMHSTRPTARCCHADYFQVLSWLGSVFPASPSPGCPDAHPKTLGYLQPCKKGIMEAQPRSFGLEDSSTVASLHAVNDRDASALWGGSLGAADLCRRPRGW